MVKVAGLFAVIFGAVACSSSMAEPKLAQGPAAESSDAPSITTTLAAKIEAREEPKAEPEPLPTACAAEGAVKDAKACLPPAEFAKKLCSGSYPEVALGLFAKGTPWTRIWLAGDVDAWNASGGLSARTKLAFDEEVIVLSKHAPNTGGIVMTGAAASYDVVRADGSCYSVMDGEITTRRPPTPKLAAVPWSRLEETTRRALTASPKVRSSLDAFGKACSGEESGGAARSAAEQKNRKACDKAERVFTAMVADAMRSGATLPVPARRP